jgi:hypothetical protein
MPFCIGPNYRTQPSKGCFWAQFDDRHNSCVCFSPITDLRNALLTKLEVSGRSPVRSDLSSVGRADIQCAWSLAHSGLCRRRRLQSPVVCRHPRRRETARTSPIQGYAQTVSTICRAVHRSARNCCASPLSGEVSSTPILSRNGLRSAASLPPWPQRLFEIFAPAFSKFCTA